jgi:hypothetical protein
MDVEIEIPGLLLNAKQMLRDIIHLIKVIRSKSFSYRGKDVLTRLTARSRMGDIDEAKVMQQVLAKEKQAQQWARIGRTKGPQRRKGISGFLACYRSRVPVHLSRKSQNLLNVENR